VQISGEATKSNDDLFGTGHRPQELPPCHYLLFCRELIRIETMTKRESGVSHSWEALPAKATTRYHRNFVMGKLIRQTIVDRVADSEAIALPS
jgi:hypothetical protein